MTFRVAQISDTHLSGDKPFFVENFKVVAAALTASAPDLVVNTGDLSAEGASAEADLAAARRLHDAIALPMLAIPGNHDVGEGHDVPGSKEAPISAERRARYLRHFGGDYWLTDAPGWRLIGIDVLLLATDLEAAGGQLDFLARAVASREGRQLALFVHKPLFDASPSETAVSGRFVNPAARARLLGAFGALRPAVVASGHVHQYRATDCEGTRCVWGPSTGFIMPDARQPIYGEKEVGYVEHRFGPDGGYASSFVRVPGLQRLNIADFAAAFGKAT
jgi:3',5'-cyclic AMP phosphodiesterase CpdA